MAPLIVRWRRGKAGEARCPLHRFRKGDRVKESYTSFRRADRASIFCATDELNGSAQEAICQSQPASPHQPPQPLGSPYCSDPNCPSCKELREAHEAIRRQKPIPPPEALGDWADATRVACVTLEKNRVLIYAVPRRKSSAGRVNRWIRARVYGFFGS
jgi:hypothetical protein